MTAFSFAQEGNADTLLLNGKPIPETTFQKDSADMTLEEIHSWKKATLLSAVLPGAGQIYNKKYWKLPILYGGFAACVYFINDNTVNYNYLTQQLIYAVDDDPNTSNTSGFELETLRNNRDLYQKWRDLAYFSLAGVYILQVLDANVDGHLYHFDISPDISLDWSPRPVLGKPGIGFGLTF